MSKHLNNFFYETWLLYKAGDHCDEEKGHDSMERQICSEDIGSNFL
jgi:hypothetical protein